MRLFSNTNENEQENKEPVINEQVKEETNQENDKISPISSPNHSSGSRLVEEDVLLIQIDEFRKKAEALQSLINDRQDKVINLEETVRQKEAKNYELQAELAKKQEALNSVFEDMKSQFDIMANRMDTSVNNAINEAKEPVFEKIHTENVRLYRNLYDFIKEDYDIDEINSMVNDMINKNVGALKGFSKAAFFLSIFNTLLLLVLILLGFGVF